MTTEVERQLIDLKQGDHICLIYETKAEQMAAAVPFMKEGLARGERCLYIADDCTVEAIAQAFAAAGVDVAQERQRGALWLLTKQDSYLKSGKFDPRTMIEFLGTAQTQALAEGFSGLRVTGEMTWALGPGIEHNRLIEYEALLNRHAADSRSVFLCQYNRERFGPAVIHDVLLTHPFAVLGDQVCPNPFYYPPDLALRWPGQPEAELMAKRVDWRIRQLKESRRAAQERERVLEKLKLSEEALRESERKLAQAQRVAHLGYWEYDINANRITGSDEVCRIVGLPPHTVLTMAEFRKMIHPEDWPIHANAFAQALQGHGTYDVEYRVVRPDGEVRFIHSIDEVIRDESGRPRRAFGVWQDITELKQSERRLAEAQVELNRQKERIGTQLAELEQIYAYAPVGLGVVDRNLRFVRINEQLAAMNGRSVAEHIGRTVREVIPQLADEIEQLWNRVMTSGKPILNVEIHGAMPAEPGVERHWLVNYVPLKSETGAVVGGTGAAVEITDRKRSEEQFRAYAQRVQDISRRLLTIQEEERAHLARELHDEVGQLLTGLRLLLKSNGASLSEGGQSNLQQAQTIVDTLLNKVRGLSFDLRPAVLDQLGLLPALLELFENYTKQTGVQVSFKHKDVERRFAPELETTAYRIVQEALTNVARHAGVGGVTVRVWATQDLLSVQIEDQGRGFDPEAILTTSRSSGLAGMRERVMLLRGELTIDSRPDGGTQITAELPLERPASEEP